LASDPNAPSSLAAKRAAAQEDGFLREVDEALREEQFFDQLRRYGRPLAVIIGVGLLALAGWLWWDNSVKAKAAEKSEQLTIALDKLEGGGVDAAVKDLEPLAREGSAGSRASAAMVLAGIALEKGKADDATKRFAAIAADSTMPQAYRDLATLREVTIRFDALKPEEAIARLKPLAVPGKPYFGGAGELMAMAYLAQGKNDQAGALLAQMGKDKSVPDTIRSRARQKASGLGYDGGEEPAENQVPGATPAIN
jgi:hypothetical protein